MPAKALLPFQGVNFSTNIKKRTTQNSDFFFARERGPARLRRSFKQILERGQSERVEVEERSGGEREDGLEEGQLGDLDSLRGHNIDRLTHSKFKSG